jgi:hypothetical protein
MSKLRSEEELYALMNKALDAIDDGVSKYPGMSYEQGVRDALEYALGDADEDPLSEE